MCGTIAYIFSGRAGRPVAMDERLYSKNEE
jgi:hypothetical protein